MEGVEGFLEAGSGNSGESRFANEKRLDGSTLVSRQV